MKNHFSKVLTSTTFIIGLLLLLLNDFLLKDLFHNGFTGKLSDFAGIFVFGLFWAALFPKKKVFTLLLIGVLFTLWKSPLSAGFIENFNAIAPYKIGRVIDYSDLTALLVLPLAYWYLDIDFKAPSIKMYKAIPLGLAVFSFLATSKEDDGTYPLFTEIAETYQFNVSYDTLTAELLEIPNIEIGELPDNTNPVNTYISVNSGICPDYIMSFEIRITKVDEENTTLELVTADYYCEDKVLTKTELINVFKTEVLDKIKSVAILKE